MPPKNRAKHAPNQHDKRHENGLAPPGKPITRRSSNGQLNGQSGSKIASSTSQVFAPSTGVNAASKSSRPADLASLAQQHHAALLDSTERDRKDSDASGEDGGRCGGTGDINHDPASTPCVEAQTPVYTGRGRPAISGRLATVSTLLSYYPLRDAISILILLLSLPPTLVLVIQTLFTSLTFVPPTVNISLATLPNVKEMFNSTNFGYPALATILIVDLIFWVCWMPVWKPLQGMFLDMSQAVIAVSLSGASASASGPTYSIATTTSIVFIVHVLRYQAIHLTALDYLRSVVHKMGIGIPIDVPFVATNYVNLPSIDRGWFYTVLRTVLGIHIVSQGVTICVRRSLVKANEQGQGAPTITTSEPDAAAGSLPITAPEASSHVVNAQSTDHRPPGIPPSQRETNQRDSTRKKRKQANQIRSQQPLWAAIASTKVTFVKEMEQRDGADDAREAARMETSMSFSSSHSKAPSGCRMWICEVRHSEILFNVELPAEAAIEQMTDAGDGPSASTIDKSKPFYVRVNGASWSSVRLSMGSSSDEAGNPTGDRYDGEISGLAPLSSYNCEIVGVASQSVLCSTSVITQAAPTAEQATSVSSQPLPQSLRPSSPITTLKQSIQQAESRLNEARTRLKKGKKDQRALQADVKREITTLKSKLESFGGIDDKQEKRLLQITQHKNQAEEATSELRGQIESLGDLPTDETAEADAKRRKWKSASDAKHAASRDLDNAKAEVEREMSALKADIAQSQSKREKLVARRTQRAQEMEKLVARQQADTAAKQKRDIERAQSIQKREEEEAQFQFHITALDAEAQKLQQKANDAYQELAALQSWSTQPPPYPGYSSPPTPETAFAGMNNVLPSPISNGFPTFAAHSAQPSFHSAQASMHARRSGARGRSSSMLSQYSGFTDPDDDVSYGPEQMRPHDSWPISGSVPVDDRKARQGSGSLTSDSTSSNSPRPDAKVFGPGKAALVGPIAPPSRNKEKNVQDLR